MTKKKTGNEEELEQEAQTPVEGEEVEEPTGEEEEETPFWLQEEEPDSSGGEEEEEVEDEEEEEPAGGDAVPVATHVKTKKKLKAKLKDADDELERLRKENEELKKGVKAPEQQAKGDLPEPPKRPRRSEFDDDDAYDEAFDKYEEQRREYDAEVIARKSQQNQQTQQRIKQVEQAVDDHYSRAEKLVEKHSIKPENYQKADASVKGIIQSALPDYDPEAVFNGMVEMIGEGSEITMYRIGRHKETGEKFANLLQQDPSGLKAALFLGRITEQVGGAKPKKTSRAPAPAAKAKGGEGPTSAKSNAAKKKWADAHRKGNVQQAYNLKKQARAQGIDVSSWK